MLQGINRLDFFIVCSALGGYGIEIALSMAGEESGASSAQATTSFRLVRLTRVLRAARAVRLGKLLFRSDTVRRTLSEAFASLDAVFNLIGMLMFVLFVVSVCCGTLEKKRPSSGVLPGVFQLTIL